MRDAFCPFRCSDRRRCDRRPHLRAIAHGLPTHVWGARGAIPRGVLSDWGGWGWVPWSCAACAAEPKNKTNLYIYIYMQH